MCECGCIDSGTKYKLPAPDGFYTVNLLPGCSDCSIGPSIHIMQPGSMESYIRVEELLDLPVMHSGTEHAITLIRCGPNPNEVTKDAKQHFTVSEVEEEGIDEFLAYELLWEYWKAVLSEAPSIVGPGGLQ